MDDLEAGRLAYETHAWMDVFESLARVDQDSPLGAEDLELFATSAFMLGRYDNFIGCLERAQQAYVERDEPLRAVRCAFWMGVNLATRGEMGPASGWFGRAQRLLEGRGECVERGFLLLPIVLRSEAAGEWEAAERAASEAAAIAERFSDADLYALAIHARGRALCMQGSLEQGLGLLDQAMVAVIAGELAPIVTGIIYCSVIEGCQAVFELRRAREWTSALTRWCDEQPDLVSFTGKCLMHRSEILQLHGDWSDALDEARRASDRFVQSSDRLAAAQVLYQRGELHRLQGDYPEAEEAYREASRSGWEPQPGLALLRLAQGNEEAAAAAIRRAVGEATEVLKRVRLLSAYVEIMLTVGEVPEARGACDELEEISAQFESSMLRAMVATARGAVTLAEGDAWAALSSLRTAGELWQELEVPYEVARVRALVGEACRSVGDNDSAALELEAACDALAELGAKPDLARVRRLTSTSGAKDSHGLTPRELEVLALVAAGKTNREIADELVISEKTVARHVSNIFTKLRLSSRSAATAFAYEHGLL